MELLNREINNAFYKKENDKTIICQESINNMIKDTKLNEYFELIEEINRGSVGRVYKAKFKTIKTERFAACKFLLSKKPEEISEKVRKEKNEKPGSMEILIHSKLKHKNIPDIYGYYTINGGGCISMEYEKFGDLRHFRKELIKKNYFTEALISYISVQILQAILYLHINKIIHMDIKQENVLIDECLTAKLTDFSVSLQYRSAKKHIQLKRNGTCYYMSPEILSEKKIQVKNASKIDMYSFGVLLYSMAFSDYPFEIRNINSKDYDQFSKQIQEKKLKFPENTGHSKMFKNFIKKCLEKDIRKRYNIYEAMNDPWVKSFRILEDEREKLFNTGKFLINLLANNIVEFNDYVNKDG